MKVGVVLPQGWMQEYRDRGFRDAWANTVAVAQAAERIAGFESVWLYDHFHTWPRPEDVIVFEPFVALSALATLTEKVRLGHIVICTGFRNPALVAKMISTLDVVSDGRAELGIGAGWKQEEWEAFGYDYPSTGERLAALRGAPADHHPHARRHERRARHLRGPAGAGGRCHQPAQATAVSARPGDGRGQRP